MKSRIISLCVLLMLPAGLAHTQGLIDAIKADNASQVKEILKANPALVNGEDQDWLPLSLAARSGFNDIVEILIANNADVNGKDINGFTALHSSAITDKGEAVAILLAHGANVNTRETLSGGTPLHLAASSGSKSVVEVLLAHGAEVNAEEESGVTPLDYAIAGNYPDIAALLRAHGGQANYLLHDAAYAGDAATVLKMLAADPQTVNAKDKHGRTPLHEAASSGNKQIVQILLDHGAEINAEDNDGATPLYDATIFLHSDVADLLRQRGGTSPF